jgi:DNA-binding response OmpR family regulator
MMNSQSQLICQHCGKPMTLDLSPRLVSWGGWTLNESENLLSPAALPAIKLERRQAEIIGILLRAEGQFLATDSMLTAIYGRFDRQNWTTLKVQISKIRKRFRLRQLANPIESLKGRGYRMLELGE